MQPAALRSPPIFPLGLFVALFRAFMAHSLRAF